MNKDSINVIRDSTRKSIGLHRRAQRNEETNFRRHIGTTSITPEAIQEIASKLKTKLPTSVFDLKTLKNGLMKDPKFIEIVLNTHGALKGLVKELSGHDVKKQYEAAGCICNLAMGDSKAGVTVAKAAGPYLIAALDSLSTELAITSAWALGNIAGSGPRACQILTAQGAIKLHHLLQANNEDVRSAAIYALLHYSRNIEGDINSEHLTNIFKSLSNQELDLDLQLSQLLFILSCHREFNVNILSEKILQNILHGVTVSMDHHFSTCRSAKECCKLVYLIRTLANLEISDGLHDFLLKYLVENNLCEKFKILLSSDSDVNKAFFWFLGNLFNHRGGDHEFFRTLLN